MPRRRRGQAILRQPVARAIGTALDRLTFDPSVGILGSNVYTKAGGPRAQRAPAGDARSADPAYARARAAARPGHRPRHPGAVRQRADRRAWLALPRPAASRRSR